ncbi:MAG: nicotinate phosphoribosyltransferase [Chitinophagales bacterium]
MKISNIYNTSLSLLTDLYQLTMAYGYWKNGIAEQEAVFHLFFRKLPFNGNYAVACGLETAIAYIEAFKFEEEDLQYLKTLKGNDGKALFEERFIDFLRHSELSLDIDAIAEGTVVYPHEPLVRVKGALWQCQLLETALLNIINFQTLIATKAARVCQAAKGEAVLEFGLRRAQGIDGGISASRAAYIGGCVSTSNVLAGRLFDIPVKGTHAHSWVMCFDEELEAFEAYAAAMPNNCIFLVDTYDTIEGVKKAIVAGKKLRERGYEMVGIRLDSGDMAALSIAARSLLDKAGFQDAAIVASSDLDEYKIKELKENGAKITVWGVGTKLVTAYDQAALGGVYKLAAIRDKYTNEWEYRIKRSNTPIKTSNPGILKVKRYSEGKNAFADVIYNELAEDSSRNFVEFGSEREVQIESHLKEVDLLQAIFRNGKRVYQNPSIHAIRKHSIAEVNRMGGLKNYKVGLEKSLHELKEQMLGNKVKSKSTLLSISHI